jgi:hypothetical protein
VNRESETITGNVRLLHTDALTRTRSFSSDFAQLLDELS